MDGEKLFFLERLARQYVDARQEGKSAVGGVRLAGPGLAIAHHSLTQARVAPCRFVWNATGSLRDRRHEWPNRRMLEFGVFVVPRYDHVTL